jgi:hypothetical protein
MPVIPWVRLAIPAALYALGFLSGYVMCYRWAVEPLRQEKAATEAVARFQSERNQSLTLKGQADQHASNVEVAALRARVASQWVRNDSPRSGGVPDVHPIDSADRPAPDGSEGSCSEAASPAIATAVATLMADDAIELDLLACRRDLRACAAVCRDR